MRRVQRCGSVLEALKRDLELLRQRTPVSRNAADSLSLNFVRLFMLVKGSLQSRDFVLLRLSKQFRFARQVRYQGVKTNKHMTHDVIAAHCSLSTR